jgi:hypothetical protein
MTDLAETLEIEATEIEQDIVLEDEADAIGVTPARPRLPAYVSHF